MPARMRSTVKDRETLRRLFTRYWRTKDLALRQQLALAHDNLATFLARKFAERGEPLEDIMQVAQIGLLGAIDRFDPTRGIEFSTFATATILGEIKRYFRDKSWSIHVPRRLRELNNSLMRTVESLGHQLGRSPTIPEIADAAGVSFEEVVAALEVGQAYNPVSLDAEPAGSGGDDAPALKEQVGSLDPEMGRLEDRQAIERALSRLPERERTVLRMRFYEERSQAEIARHLGISQMHVSRVQREALRLMRALMSG